MGKNKTDTIQTSDGVKKNLSLKKALAILEVMVDLRNPARLQDIANQVELSPSTTLRFINTFQEYGYISQDKETSCYYLTLKLADLGARNRQHYPFQSTLSKYVKLISSTFNESASLCVERNMQMIYIATQDGPEHMLQTLSRIGRIAPMHATGTGKLHLLNYTDEQLDLLQQTKGLAKYTSHTITTIPELKKELSIIKKQGYAFDNEECEEGVKCIAVPVIDYAGSIIASLSLSAPIARLGTERTNKIITFLKELSINASKEFGWRG